VNYVAIVARDAAAAALLQDQAAADPAALFEAIQARVQEARKVVSLYTGLTWLICDGSPPRHHVFPVNTEQIAQSPPGAPNAPQPEAANTQPGLSDRSEDEVKTLSRLVGDIMLTGRKSSSWRSTNLRAQLTALPQERSRRPFARTISTWMTATPTRHADTSGV